MNDLVTAGAIARAVRTREVSAHEVVTAALDRIAATDPAIHSFLSVHADEALERARTIDETLEPDDPRPLLGVPVGVKDNICTRGRRTTAGSRMLETFVPPYDATAIERLERAGAIVVGKTNCDEFAMGSSTENSAFGPTRNPWALDRIPGGSSGGSAAAVAARLTPVALGSDTGGSVRQPAALCGVVGLKPTYGRISRYGLIAFGSSLDQIGPMALTVDDCALVYAAVAGHDPHDATSSDAPVPPVSATDLRGRRIGVPHALLGDGVDAGVLAAFESALDTCRDAGAELVAIDLPHASYAIPTYYLVACAEASSNLARYDGVRYGFRASVPADGDLATMYDRTRDQGFGAEVKRRIMLGTYALSTGYYDAYYLKAQQVRTLIQRDYQRAFEAVDVVAMPTSPVPAFGLGERMDDPLQMYLADVFTVSANLAGLPAISVPCGLTPGALPVGLQLTGRPFDESTLLGLAAAFDAVSGSGVRLPPYAAR